jgi:signal transduction histidine kinase
LGAKRPAAELEMLRALVDAAPVGLVFADRRGEFQFGNPAAQLILGRLDGNAGAPRGYALLKPDRTPFRSPELPMVRALESGQPVDNVEILLRRADGTEALLLVSARPVRSADRKRITGSVAMLIDLTTRQHAELERARAKDEFLAIVSHELRTPLNAITGWAHMLDQHTLDAETIQKAVQTIIRNAHTQARLINDLLDMSRIISGQLRLDVQELELIPVIENAIETLRPAADAKRIELTTHLDPKAEPILGDATRMQQVVWNLVSNAIKFTSAGGRVEVRLERAGTHVRVVVSDTGIGIRSTFLPYVFDRFRQGDPSSESPRGLGLGLSIVRHLAELHGGTVEVRSDGEGRGATFVVTIPWWNPRNIEAAVEAAPDTIPPPVDLKGLRVLLVEDEADTRELLTYMLSRFNATVSAVSSTSEALRDIQKFQPDVLVSDLNMPGADGFELIRQIRKRPPDEGGRVPAVALSALARGEDRRNALAAGYQVHVPKPVTPAKLTAVLGFVLRQRPPQRRS